MTAMAETTDPIEEEAERVFADAETRARIEAFHARAEAGGPVRGVSHNEARRIVGLPPLPEHDLADD